MRVFSGHPAIATSTSTGESEEQGSKAERILRRQVVWLIFVNSSSQVVGRHPSAGQHGHLPNDLEGVLNPG